MLGEPDKDVFVDENEENNNTFNADEIQILRDWESDENDIKSEKGE